MHREDPTTPGSMWDSTSVNTQKRIGDARVEYDQIDVDALSSECVSKVAVPLEDAYNAYVDALEMWNRCLDRYTCELDDIDGKMQVKWIRATGKDRHR